MVIYLRQLLVAALSAVACSAGGQPLALHPENSHYFIYKNKPVVIVGSGEHYGAVINKRFDYKLYLQTLRRDGLNNTRLFTGAYIEKQGDFGIGKNTLAPASTDILLPWRRSSEPGYELGGNKFDLSQWDEEYFRRLTDFIQTASRYDVIVEVNLFSAYYGGGWNYSALNRKNNINNTTAIEARQANTLENGNILSYQEKYVRRIVRALNEFDNIYFEIQNEPWADQTDTVFTGNAYGNSDDWRTTIQVTSSASIQWQRRVAQWIVDEEASLPKKHLISQNIANFYYPITEPDPNVSVFNFHYAFPVAVSQNHYLNKPIGLNETGFAGGEDVTYRRQAWRFMMAGGALFNHLDYSFSVGGETGNDTTYKAPGGGSPALRTQLGVLKRYLEQLDIVRLKPDLSVVKAAPGASAAVLSDGKTTWVIYVEALSKKSYDIVADIPRGRYEVVWTDTVSGLEIATYTLDGAIVKVPGWRGDKVGLVRVRK